MKLTEPVAQCTERASCHLIHTHKIYLWLIKLAIWPPPTIFVSVSGMRVKCRKILIKYSRLCYVHWSDPVMLPTQCIRSHVGSSECNIINSKLKTIVSYSDDNAEVISPSICMIEYKHNSVCLIYYSCCYFMMIMRMHSSASG